jgi:hypothetical protein
VAIGKLLATTGMSAVALNKSVERKEKEKEKEEELKSGKRAKSAKKPKTVLNLEAPDQKTHLKAENFKNAKIMPLIEEAWDLLNKIKSR